MYKKTKKKTWTNSLSNLDLFSNIGFAVNHFLRSIQSIIDDVLAGLTRVLRARHPGAFARNGGNHTEGMAGS